MKSLISKFLIYGLGLVVPNIGIIWYFFYLASIFPNRLLETKFFWTIIVQLSIGVSIYAYVWGRWFFPKLERILDESKWPSHSEHDSRASKEHSRDAGKR